MADQTDPQPYESSLPELKLPPNGFESVLPDHLLVNESAAMKWLMTETSKTTQAVKFACEAAVVHNEHLRKLNGKTHRNEKAAEEVKAELAALKEQSAVAVPVVKAFSYLSYLWEYKTFKVVLVAGLFLIIGLIYPWYLENIYISIKGVLSHLMGT